MQTCSLTQCKPLRGCDEASKLLMSHVLSCCRLPIHVSSVPSWGCPPNRPRWVLMLLKKKVLFLNMLLPANKSDCMCMHACHNPHCYPSICTAGATDSGEPESSSEQSSYRHCALQLSFEACRLPLSSATKLQRRCEPRCHRRHKFCLMSRQHDGLLHGAHKPGQAYLLPT